MKVIIITCKPLLKNGVDAAPGFNLAWYSFLRVLKTREAHVFQATLIDLGRGSLQKHPGVGEGRGERVVEQLDKLLQLPVDCFIKGLIDERLDHLVVLNYANRLRVQRRVPCLVRCRISITIIISKQGNQGGLYDQSNL